LSSKRRSLCNRKSSRSQHDPRLADTMTRRPSFDALDVGVEGVLAHAVRVEVVLVLFDFLEDLRGEA
jgi:hypothetical protein